MENKLESLKISNNPRDEQIQITKGKLITTQTKSVRTGNSFATQPKLNIFEKIKTDLSKSRIPLKFRNKRSKSPLSMLKSNTNTSRKELSLSNHSISNEKKAIVKSNVQKNTLNNIKAVAKPKNEVKSPEFKIKTSKSCEKLNFDKLNQKSNIFRNFSKDELLSNIKEYKLKFNENKTRSSVSNEKSLIQNKNGKIKNISDKDSNKDNSINLIEKFKKEISCNLENLTQLNDQKLKILRQTYLVNQNYYINNNINNNIKIDMKKEININLIKPSNTNQRNNISGNSSLRLKKIMNYANRTQVGFQGKIQKKYNQDCYFVQKNFAESVLKDSYFFGVCDGHGSSGHKVSSFLKENLPKTLNSDIQRRFKSTNFHKIIKESFYSVNCSLFNEANIDSQYSGSTCISLIFTNESIYTCNVGDSRAILAKNINGKFKVFQLSHDHKPDSPEESERIISKNGRIEPFKDDKKVNYGPQRVWLKNKNVPGLAMSRSFGDQIGTQVGIIAEPEIIECKLEMNDSFIVLASDGIWEFISNEECVDIVKDFYLKNDAIGAANYLVEESFRRWTSNEEIVDDITVIVIFLEN